jgi:peptidoglycan/xylan/chitin deacetylase (PgdA/CDA1 family)
MNKSHGDRWRWPDDAPAAISLTYDDGNENNLDQAIPDLEELGFRGTFYLQTGRPQVRNRSDDWRKAFLRGHEIGNHTVTHPCRAEGYGANIPEWLPPERRLENYSADDIERELADAALWLDEHVGKDPKRTFAHPCCATAIGVVPDEASYDAAIRRHASAARVGGQRVNDPFTADLMRIASFGVNEPTAEELIGFCEQARERRGWTVIMFHGIGGPSHTTARDVHRNLLEYLRANHYYVRPLRDVARHIADTREKTSS